MKLVFIRHAEPDYDAGTLTPKGEYEAELLAKRIENWDVTQFYCSPLLRAELTAKPTLTLLNREAITLDWIQEFKEFVQDYTNPDGIIWPWDFPTDFLIDHQELFDRNRWLTKGIMTTGPIKKHYEWVCGGLDKLLCDYGYTRDGLYYTKEPAAKTDATIVCFCHQEVMLAIISYLTNASGSAIWQGYFIPPCSVTIFNTFDYADGHSIFKCQALGDVSHLLKSNEPVSYYGYMTPPFQG